MFFSKFYLICLPDTSLTDVTAIRIRSSTGRHRESSKELRKLEVVNIVFFYCWYSH